MHDLAARLLRVAHQLLNEDDELPPPDQDSDEFPSYVHVEQNITPILGPPLRTKKLT